MHKHTHTHLDLVGTALLLHEDEREALALLEATQQRLLLVAVLPGESHTRTKGLYTRMRERVYV